MADDPLYMSAESEDRILGAAARRRQQFEVMQRQVTPNQIRRAAEVSERWPQASPGVVQASAQLELPDEQVDQIAGRDDGGWSWQSALGSAVGFLSDGVEKAYEYAVKPAIRGAFTVSEGLAEEVARRPLTAGFAAAQGEASFGQSYQDYGDSAFRNVIQGDFDQQDSLGTGLVPGGSAQAQSEEERTLTIDGRSANFGRVMPTSRAAGAMFGYDSTAYNFTAGITQFAADVLLDPLAIATGGSATAARAAGKLGASARTVQAIEGGVSGAARRARRLDASEATGLLSEARGASGARRSPLLDELGDDPIEVFHGTYGELGHPDSVALHGGIHVGSRRAAEDALSNTKKLVDSGFEAVGPNPRIISGKLSRDKVYAADSPLGEGQLANITGDKKRLSELGEQYDAIAYVNDVEDVSGVSYLVLNRKALVTDEDLAADALQHARDVKNAVGMVEGGGRQSVVIEKVQNFFGDRDLLSNLAGASRYDIYQSFKRSPANQIDTATIRRLGDARTEMEVSEILLDSVQQARVTEKGFYSGLKGARRRIRDSRLAGQSPRGKVSLDDLDDSTDKLDSWLRQARVGRDQREEIFNKMLDLNDPATPWADRADRLFETVTDAMDMASGNMAGELGAIKRITAVVGDDMKAFRQYGVDVAGEPIMFPHIKKHVDPGTGTEIASPTPHLTSELLQEGMDLPDITAVRRAAKRASHMEELYKTKGWAGVSDAARFLTRDLFKPLAILRPAYVLRIGLEEQARLAAAGYDSLLNHPFRFIQANIKARQHDTSLLGDTFEEVADGLNAVNRSAYNVADRGHRASHTAKVWSQMQKPVAATPEFIDAWRHELAQLSGAREARYLARNGGDLDDFMVWARQTAEGKEQVSRISRINPDINDIATSDDSLRAWGQSVNERIAAKTGGEVRDGVVTRLGDEDLLDAVATGRVHGAQLTEKTTKASLSNFLRGKFDVAPQRLKYDTSLIGDQAKNTNRMNKGIDFLFDNITGKPTNTLARYPAFRQSYIKNVGETMDALADDGLRREFADNLDKMFTLTKAEKERIGRAVEMNAGKAGFYDDITELDEVLKVRAASEVKELLFDVTKRSNIQDSYEVAVPFFDAWTEVTKTWARLAKDNPSFFLRAGAGLQSAREEGVIYANDFGEEVFAYPGGGLLSKFFPGEDTVTMEGRLQGANLVAQGVGPGFGPVVQWATGAFLSKDKDLQQLREWLAPFGTAGIESSGDLSDPGNIVGALVPAWMNKVTSAMTAGQSDPVQWNSMMGDVTKVLAGSGSYQPGNPTDQQRLLDDAEKGTRFLMFMRAVTQGIGITGASATWRVKTDGPDEGEQIPEGWEPKADPDGTFHVLGTLASEYRRLREHYNYDDELAVSAFVDLYGVEPFYAGQSKTKTLSNLPVDQEGFSWVQEHDAVARELPSTIGYFVPPDADAELDYSIYRSQIDAGDRQSLTGEQQIQLANKAKAYQILNTVKSRVSELPKAAQDKAVGHTRAALEAQFPGFQAPVLGVGESLNSKERIDQLRIAVQDDRLADSPLTEPLRAYMRVRDAMLQVANERGVKTLGAQASVDLAQRLNAVGVTLAAADSAFAGVWSQLLSQEVSGE